MIPRFLSLVLIATLGLLAPVTGQSSLAIDVWYGDTQTFGTNGHPQRWVNVLGTVEGATPGTSLWVSVNGGSERRLNVGPDQRRLVGTGDFNADIDIAELVDGPNQVALRAVDDLGREVTRTVTVAFEAGANPPGSLTIDWSSVTDLQDVAQVVDGKWIVTPEGVRTAQVGYDRVLALGDLGWRDFEITVPFTVHSVDPSGNNPISGTPAIGIAARWVGHFQYGGSDQQPLYDWRPYGGGPWHSFGSTERLQLIGWDGMSVNDPAKRSIPLDVRHYWKLRCETLDDGDTFYAMKMWREGSAEPTRWELVGREGVANLASGSAILIAHHVDATFGDVVIESLADDARAPALTNVAAVPYANSITLLCESDEPATLHVDYGLTSMFEIGRVTRPGQDLVHRVRVTDLLAGTSYRLRPTFVDGHGNVTQGQEIVVSTTSGPEVALESDAFSAPFGPPWVVEDRFGTQTVDTVDGFLRIHLPGDYDRIGVDATRIVRPVVDRDFEVTVAFASPLEALSQVYGITAEQGADTAVQATIRRRLGRTQVFVTHLDAGSATNLIVATISDTVLPPTATPFWLRLSRRGDHWQFDHSTDRVVWVPAGSWELPLAPTRVGILAGNQWEPGTVLVDSFDVAAPDTRAPVISAHTAAASGTRALIRWTTDEPASSEVRWGPDRSVSSSILRTEHSLEIDGLLPDTEYEYRISSVDSAGNAVASGLLTLRTGSPLDASGIVSDSFDVGPVDEQLWTFVSPKPGASVTTLDGELVMVSAGPVREIWSHEYSVPRLLQPVIDGDFTLITHYDSTVTGDWRAQGIVFEQESAGEFLRVELLSLRNRLRLFVAVVRGGKATTLLSLPLEPPLGAPYWLRVRRSGFRWTIGWSPDGTNFEEAPTLFVPLRVRRLGPYVAHSEGNTHTARIAAFVNAASPPVDARPPQILGLTVGSNDTSAIARWSTDEPCTSFVQFGPSAGYGQAVSSAVPTLTHELQLPPLVPATTYHFRVGAVDAGGNLSLTQDGVFRTAAAGNASGLRSDAFDGSPSNAIWDFVDPSGDGEVVFEPDSAEIRLSGAVAHDAWNGPNGFARLLQSVFDEDFVAEVTFASDFTASVQVQGVMAEEDEDSLLRAEFHLVNGKTRVFVATIDDGQPTVRANLVRPLVAPMTLRLARTSDLWTVQFSLDREHWETATAFVWDAAVRAVGPFAGNSVGTPFVARIASFRSGAEPLPDNTPPTQTDIRVVAADDRLVVRWRTDEPAIGAVEVGPSPSYGTMVVESAPTTQHEVVVPGLAANSLYHWRVSSEDPASNRTTGPDSTIRTAVAGNRSGLRSDTFEGFDTSLWSVTDPLGDATITTDAGNLLMSVPAQPNHELWANVDTAPRVLQEVNDADFGIELTFASLPSATVQAQGLLFLDGAGRALRIELLSASALNLFVGSVDNGVATVLHSSSLPAGLDPTRLRVERTGSSWSVAVGQVPSGWHTLAAFDSPMVVRRAGLSVGNTAGTAQSALFAEFVSTAEPLPDQQPPTLSAPERAVGDDAVAIRWSSDERTLGRVEWGATIALGSSTPSHGGALAEDHEVVLGPLLPATPVFYRIVSADSSGNETTTQIFETVTASAGLHAGAASDAFDGAELAETWIVRDPHSASTLQMTGSALHVSVPAGIAHDPWTKGIDAPRIVQAVVNRDFDVSAAFSAASPPDLVAHGLCAETATGGFLRVEFLHRSAGLYLFVAHVQGQSATILLNRKVGPAGSASGHLRLTRSGDTFVVSRSADGLAWSTETTFAAATDIRYLGVHLANPTANAHAVDIEEFVVRPTP